MATRYVAVQTEDSVCGSLSLWGWLTAATVTSTATQTLVMGARCTNGVPSRGSIGWSCRRCSITSSLPSTSGGTLGVRRALTLRQRCWKQMQERLHNIARDMYILNRSCGEEIVRSSLVRARKAAPKRRRRAQRNRVRQAKQACSDTVEESISSTYSPKERARV